jgi:BirA family transcriptional regulator, biotin operon repressor / biotin---[acetyl-CoA-carboxylase] ligase
MLRRIHYETIDSTNTEARRLAEGGLVEPLLVTATEQFAGRGRNGRSWHSPRGGAWLSLAWPVRKPPIAYSAISLAAAVGVLRGLQDIVTYAADIRIKWPNDLLVNDRKVVGILCEQLVSAGSAQAIIIGVGVNVDFDPAALPSDLRHPATTLRAAFGKELTVDEVNRAVAERLVEVLEEYELYGLTMSVISEVRDRLAYVGSQRLWSTAAGTIEGRVAGIDDAGRLLLDTATGRIACETGEFAAAQEAADRNRM